MRYEIADFKVKALVQANPTFFRAFTEASKESAFTGFPVLEKVVRIASNELGI